MRLVPRDTTGAITFFTSHAGTWLEHASAIGTSAAEVEAMAAKLEAARVAYSEQYQAQLVARSATNRLNMAMEELRTAGAEIVQKIRAKAASGGNGIYALASISVPKDASPIAAPGQPTRFSVQLRQDGSLALEWKCKNPRGSTGTMYHVYRSMGLGEDFQFLGSVGQKKFIDETLPAGAATVTYQVIAIRSTATGPIARHVVHFGGSGRQMLPGSIQVKGRAAA